MALIEITIGKVQRVLAERYGIDLAQDHIWDLVESEDALARMIAWDVTTPDADRASIETRLERIESKVDEMQNGLLQSLLFEVQKQQRR